MLRKLFAQENTLSEDILEPIAQDPVGFFGSFVAVWQSLVNEVVPAFRALWFALGRFWWLLKNFLADWLGDPLLRAFGQTPTMEANNMTRGFFQSASDAFWGFFLN